MMERRYVFIEIGVAGTIITFVLNLATTWLVTPRHPIRLTGPGGIVDDLVVTSLILPIISSLIVTPLARRAARGRDFALSASGPVTALLPRNATLRTLVLALAGLLVQALPVLAILGGFGVAALAFRVWVVGKAAFTAAEFAWVGPLLAATAMRGRPAAAAPCGST